MLYYNCNKEPPPKKKKKKYQRQIIKQDLTKSKIESDGRSNDWLFESVSLFVCFCERGGGPAELWWPPTSFQLVSADSSSGPSQIEVMLNYLGRLSRAI